MMSSFYWTQIKHFLSLYSGLFIDWAYIVCFEYRVKIDASKKLFTFSLYSLFGKIVSYRVGFARSSLINLVHVAPDAPRHILILITLNRGGRNEHYQKYHLSAYPFSFGSFFFSRALPLPGRGRSLLILTASKTFMAHSIDWLALHWNAEYIKFIVNDFFSKNVSIDLYIVVCMFWFFPSFLNEQVHKFIEKNRYKLVNGIFF